MAHGQGQWPCLSGIRQKAICRLLTPKQRDDIEVFR